MVPSIGVMPREGSFALASFGRIRKVQEPAFSLSAGRKSFALKRIDAVFVICLVSHVGMGSTSRVCEALVFVGRGPHVSK